MQSQDLRQRLKQYGLHTREQYHEAAFARNIGLFSEREQDTLGRATVAIPGMGGVGGVHLITMARTGIGRFHLADFDTFEPANVNRQYGARVSDLGKPKLDVMIDQAIKINPYLKIKPFPDGINEANMDAFLDGVHVVLDGLDFFQFDIRRQLFNRARKKGVYVVTAGPMGFSSAMLIFSPHDGMSFDEYFNIVEGMSPEDQYLAFALGLAPRATHIKYMDMGKVDFQSKAGPSLNIACQICAGMAATETVRIILNRKGIRPVPYYFQFDPYLQKFRQGRLWWGNRNPIQRVKLWVVKHFLLKPQKPQYSPPEVTVPDERIEGDKIPESVIRYLATMGTWATSADNCQPWKFKWIPPYLLLVEDTNRTGFFYDVNHESTYIAFGALIENIKIAASHFRLETRIEVFPDKSDAGVIARLEFKADATEEDHLFPNVLDRCVNRKKYHNKPISPHIVDQLREIVGYFSGGRLFWFDDKSNRKVLQQIIYDADRVLFEDRRLHEGLFRWINLDKPKLEGLNKDVLELQTFQKPIFPLLAKWPNQRIMNYLGASRMAAVNSVSLLNSASAGCLLAVDSRKPKDYIKGGQMMERFWIKANSIGLALQPMAGFIFLLNHFHNDGAVQFQPHHKILIKKINNEFNKLCGNTDHIAPILFFRIGYAEPPSAKSPRKKAPLNTGYSD